MIRNENQPVVDTDQLQELFEVALQCDADNRHDLLQKLCGADRRLIARIEDLVAAYEKSHDVLERSPVGGTIWTEGLAKNTLFPRRIGPYEILREIHTGGMGTVFAARQDRPRRTVAVKVMRFALETHVTKRRFEFESEILARLHHPGIAQVFEAGTFESHHGRTPYFAMEYVSNARPITQYATENQLSVNERFELFCQVCTAVHFAHQKGVVHRDLKPSNILVNADGLVKIIDFGVARSLQRDDRFDTLRTETGQIVGTLAYMSPEHCQGKSDQVDTRSDVYSLGVVLYELLGGRLPYDVTEQSVYQGTRTICDSQVPRLGTLDARLGGDVETIVSKTLQKEPNQRYHSAAELADDIRRYLAGEAIIARPPSTWYQLRVFTRRNKLLVGGTIVLLLVMALGIVGTSLGLVRANKQRLAATSARQRAENAQQQAETVLDYLLNVLTAVDTYESRGPDVKLRAVLDEASIQLDNDQTLANQPLIRATLHMAIGKTYASMTAYHSSAEEHARAALETLRSEFGGEHPRVADAMHDLAVAVQYKSRPAPEAEGLFRHVLALRKRHLGDGHPDTLESMRYLAWFLAEDGKNTDEADALFRAALEGYRNTYGERHPKVARTLCDWVAVIRSPEKAEATARRALALSRQLYPEKHAALAEPLRTLAHTLSDKGALDEAELLIREAIGIYRDKFPKEHVLLGHAMTELGNIFNKRGQHSEAESTLREAITAYPSGVDVVWPLVPLGESLIGQRRYRDAERVLLDAYDGFSQSDNGWLVRTAVTQLVSLYETWGRTDEAATWQQKLNRLTLSELTRESK